MAARKFAVVLTRTTVERTTVEVEAKNHVEAGFAAAGAVRPETEWALVSKSVSPKVEKGE